MEGRDRTDKGNDERGRSGCEGNKGVNFTIIVENHIVVYVQTYKALTYSEEELCFRAASWLKKNCLKDLWPTRLIASDRGPMVNWSENDEEKCKCGSTYLV